MKDGLVGIVLGFDTTEMVGGGSWLRGGWSCPCRC